MEESRIGHMITVEGCTSGGSLRLPFAARAKLHGWPRGHAREVTVANVPYLDVDGGGAGTEGVPMLIHGAAVPLWHRVRLGWAPRKARWFTIGKVTPLSAEEVRSYR